MDLAQDIRSTAPDSDMMMEKVGSNHIQADDAAAPVSSTLSNSESVNNLTNAEVLVNSPDTNYQLVSQPQISDNRDSVLYESEYTTACDRPGTDAAAPVEQCSRGIAEGAVDCKDACFGTLQDQNADVENDLMYTGSHDTPVDVRKLGCALWRKSTFVMDVGTDYSFAALTAGHENFCEEHNPENVTEQKAVLSSCDETDTVRDMHEAEWATVSRWLKESRQQFRKQFPQCSALMYELPVSGKSDTASEKQAICVDNSQTLDSTLYSLELNAEPVSSLNTNNTSISSHVTDAGLGSESGCGDKLPSDVLLSREKILSLQFSGVPLPAQVISRINELKLKRMDSVLRPANGKRFARNTPTSKRPELNISHVARSASQSTEIPANSADGAADTFNAQSMNQCAAERHAASAVGIDTLAVSQNLPDPHIASVKQAPVDYESRTSSTNALAQEAQSSETRRVLYSHSTLQSTTSLQSMTLQSDTVPIVPVYSTLADTAVADVTSKKQRPTHGLHTKVEETTHKDGPLKSSSTHVRPLSGSAFSINTPDTTAVTRHQKTRESTGKYQLSPQTVPLAVNVNLCAKNRNENEISETMADHNYYYNDSASSPVQQHNPESKHRATDRSSPRQETHGTFTEERRRKPRQTSRHAEASVNPTDAGVSDQHNWSRSQCAKCSRARNVKHSAGTSSSKSHSSKHHNPCGMFDYYNAYGSGYMPSMTQSVLASVSYSSYCLGAYDAHIHSMHYYNHQATAGMWQQQADYIRRMAKFYTHS